LLEFITGLLVGIVIGALAVLYYAYVKARRLLKSIPIAPLETNTKPGKTQVCRVCGKIYPRGNGYHKGVCPTCYAREYAKKRRKKSA
jgi:uncharacterized paraquat-inducible protein A